MKLKDGTNEKGDCDITASQLLSGLFEYAKSRGPLTDLDGAAQQYGVDSATLLKLAKSQIETAKANAELIVKLEELEAENAELRGKLDEKKENRKAAMDRARVWEMGRLRAESNINRAMHDQEMKERDELRAKLEEAAKVAKIATDYHMVKGFDPAEVMVRETLRHIAGEQKAGESANEEAKRSADGWTNVEERLPEADTRVIATDGNLWGESRFDGEFFHMGNLNGCWRATHWMLPQLPEANP